MARRDGGKGHACGKKESGGRGHVTLFKSGDSRFFGCSLLKLPEMSRLSGALFLGFRVPFASFPPPILSFFVGSSLKQCGIHGRGEVPGGFLPFSKSRIFQLRQKIAEIGNPSGVSADILLVMDDDIQGRGILGDWFPLTRN